MPNTTNASRRNFFLGISAIGLGLLTLIAFFIFAPLGTITPPEADDMTLPSQNAPSESMQDTTPPETTLPIQPLVMKESTATIGATGDILLHDKVIYSGYDNETDTYDFTYIFRHLAGYIQSLDYAIGNMEGTMAGNEGGYDYKGYPNFNAPDAIAQSAKAVGFDMLLTANNHAYDTRSYGFHRTQQVISGLGLDHIGTRPNAETKNYIIKEINGIKIAMSCYTYDTRGDTEGKLSLNTIPLRQEDIPLINTFHHNHLDEFYSRLEQEMDEMKADGAEAIMLFIHWGEEFFTSPNKTQKAMAQKLCDMGVDVIVGGHPHVIQPMEMLTSTTDATHNTLCLYSLGNAVSNIVHSSSRPYECEDGMFFTVTFAKYSDGTVVLESVEVLPYYVNRTYDTTLERYLYPIIPLNTPADQWEEAYNLTTDMVDACQASLSRTQALLSEGLASSNAFLQQQQEQLEAVLSNQ